MKALITIELDYPEQIYDLYETKEIRFYDKEGVYMLWEGGFEIKHMPEKLADNYGNNTPTNTYIMNGTERQYLDMYAVGWNNCLNKISGEEE